MGQIYKKNIKNGENTFKKTKNILSCGEKIEMAEKIKFEVEYSLRTSIKVLYKRLSTASGLEEWFAEEVSKQDDIFEFRWNKNIQKARLLEKEKHESVKFHWLHDNDECYFSFELEKDELTNDLALIVTDFAEEDEVDDTIELWNKQINVLKRKLGM